MKSFFRLYQNLTNTHKLILGAIVFLIGIFIAVLIITRSPEFPADIPSPESAKSLKKKGLNQQDFFNQYTNYVREKHGGLIVANQQKRVETPSSSGNNFVGFFHQFKFFDRDVVFNLASQFAEKNHLGIHVKRIETSKLKGFEIDFIQEGILWVRIQVDPGETKELQTKKDEYASAETVKDVEFDKEKPAKSTPVSGKAKMIIIIDDLGQNIQSFHNLTSLGEDITYSILPNLPHSIEIAETAREKGLEVMLHLPMQPKDWPEKNPGEGALLIDDEEALIISKLEEGLRFVPNAVGANNHMGSAFVQNTEGMNTVMQVLKKRNMFFLDSKTAPGKLARNAAKQHDVAYFSRDIFIDNDQEEALIFKQLNKALSIAERRGIVVVIGHPYNITYLTLKKFLPTLKERGIEIVRSSWLLNN